MEDNRRIIVALDVDSFDRAKGLIDRLSPYIEIFKVGSELFIDCGSEIIRYINGKKRKVFLDLKFFDIPSTVRRAVRQSVRHHIFMLTLHLMGGIDMLKEAKDAVNGKRYKPYLLGVTVLTSESGRNTGKDVMGLARIAKRAGLDGVVCSARETRYIKRACGKGFIVVNPGIRPEWAEIHDQKRFATPKEAIRNGADYIVIGRPIVKAKDPILAAQKIIKEIENITE